MPWLRSLLHRSMARGCTFDGTEAAREASLCDGALASSCTVARATAQKRRLAVRRLRLSLRRAMIRCCTHSCIRCFIVQRHAAGAIVLTTAQACRATAARFASPRDRTLPNAQLRLSFHHAMAFCCWQCVLGVRLPCDGVVPLALHAVLATQWRVVAAAPARFATAVLVASIVQRYAAARPAVRVAPLRNGREAMAHRCGQPQARLCLSLHRAIACRRSQCLHANCVRCLSLNGVLPQAALAHTAARVTATARRGMTSHAVLLWARRCVLL